MVVSGAEHVPCVRSLMLVVSEAMQKSQLVTSLPSDITTPP